MDWFEKEDIRIVFTEIENEKEKRDDTIWENRGFSEQEKKEFHERYLKIKEEHGEFVSVANLERELNDNKLNSTARTIILNLARFKNRNVYDEKEVFVALLLKKYRIQGDPLPNTIPPHLTDFSKPFVKFVPLSIPSRGTVGKKTITGPTYKICVLGDSCGKTCLIGRFIYDQYYQNIPSVEDISFFNYFSNDYNTYLEIYDFGYNYYNELLPRQRDLLTQVNAFILVYSITRKETFNVAQAIRIRLMGLLRDDRIPITIVGTQLDMENSREIAHRDGKNFAKLYGCAFTECSAVTGENIETPFQLTIERIEKSKNKGISKHKWKKTYFSTPPLCNYCNTTIWGIIFQYGFYCEVCGYSCHRTCLDHVAIYCDSSKKQRPMVSTLASIRDSQKEIVTQVTFEELQSVFEDEDLYQSLYKFAQASNLSPEHLELYKNLKSYQKITDPNEKKKFGKEIYNKFLKDPEKLKDFQIPEELVTRLVRGDDHMFSFIEQFVHKHIAQTVFPRWVEQKYEEAFSDQIKPSSVKPSDKIKFDDFELLDLVGTGNYGEVWKTKWKDSIVALKRIHPEVSLDPQSKKEFLREIQLMRKIKEHPNVVKFMAVLEFPLCLITEFLPNGDLHTYLSSEKSISFFQQVKWMKDIANGMIYLELQRIIHKDLAARNVLLGENLEAKVSDFGMSRILDENGSRDYITSIRKVGPVKWMAPESVWESKYSFKSDVWSFGVTCREILTRESPVYSCDRFKPPQIREALTFPDFTPPDLKDLIMSCFGDTPDDRPPFKEILQKLQQIKS